MNMRQEQIYNLLKNYPNGLTNAEIADLVHLPINSVTPRVGELRKKTDQQNNPLVVPVGKKTSEFGHTAIIWAIPSKEMQLSFSVV
jgi:DNA-binding NarL/FixJ family response regulator